MRLQKYMAQCGVASRRKSEKMIEEGIVKLNNKIVTEQGIDIDPNKDIVMVNNKVIKLEENKIYIILNKPLGYVTTMDDEKDRKIVTDLIEDVNERIYPIGRLDMDTSGLLLLTNDGKVTNKITHPRNEIVKKYIAIVEGTPNKGELTRFRSGVIIDGKKTSPAKMKIIKNYETESILEIEINEGRNRQIRKMCEAINHPIKKLKRISIGEIQLGGLEVGEWRYLDEEEMNYIKSL
ncbi:pseudouridine synthase [Tissierella creatinophila]|uniref:Pseudouridine synthase n=1 Tax=Tissierella creatinophila DSM 6911 TaxID=1123403 RepID=A0A1U7M9J4_TISCR|nr:pseudouridine synthase [Tissierella creatinophila]OLS03956.1 ribosomal large subunit pseudouridine synthase B [Tissierella creatinophila DSM 6911]